MAGFCWPEGTPVSFFSKPQHHLGFLEGSSDFVIPVFKRLHFSTGLSSHWDVGGMEIRREEGGNIFQKCLGLRGTRDDNRRGC